MREIENVDVLFSGTGIAESNRQEQRSGVVFRFGSRQTDGRLLAFSVEF